MEEKDAHSGLCLDDVRSSKYWNCSHLASMLSSGISDSVGISDGCGGLRVEKTALGSTALKSSTIF